MSKYRTIIAQLMCVMVLISGCAAQSSSGDQTNQRDTNSTESAAAEDVDNADGSAADGGAESNSAAGESAESKDAAGESASKDPAGEDKELLKYIDAWGEWHTMEVDPTVEKSAYDAQKFAVDENNPQWITYTGPEYTVLQGIDVSEHQGMIDWEAVADEGYSFAFIRVGYRGYGQAGKLCEDSRAIANLQEAQEAGLMVGAYIFSQALNEDEAKEEAELAMRMIDESGVQLDLPLVYDPEIIKDDEGRANDITREQVALNTQAFKDAVENTSAYQVDIYSNLPWEHELFDGTTLNNYDIWYADYENPPQTPYHFIWWQYSMTGTVPGIEGNVDLDLWMVKAEE